MVIKLLLLVVFFAVMVSVGLYSRKHATSVDGYVLGGRSVGPWLTAFAYGTSYFSAVVFVGYAGQFGWKYGLASTWIGIGNAIIGSLMAWVILGRRTKVMTQHLNSKTMPDFFGARYESKALKIAASAIVFIFLVPYTASVYNGLSRLFGMAFNIPYTYCVIGMAVFTMIMGNAFAAITVITVGIGGPFVLAYGADPITIGMLALTCGYCGTLCTPMAANFNIVPVAILNMKDRWGVIKNQVIVAGIMLVFQICYMIRFK